MRSRLVVVTANAASGLDRRTGRIEVGEWADAARALAADVYAVQEVDHLLERTGRLDQTALIAARLSVGGPGFAARFAAAVDGEPGSRRTMRPAPATRAGRPSYGIALFSRYPVLWWRELRMPASRAVLPVPLPAGAPHRLLLVPDEQRVAIAAGVETSAGPVTVIGTHLSFAPWHAARQLRELVGWTHDLPRPLVLLGDLNLPGRLPALLTGWSPATRAPTYPASRPRVRLDHVLLDADPRTTRVVDSGSERLAGGDHRAVRVELRIG